MFDSLIQQFIKESNPKLDKDTFSNIGKVHDWRNHVGDLRLCWHELNLREKQIAAYVANIQAQNEEWD